MDTAGVPAHLLLLGGVGTWPTRRGGASGGVPGRQNRSQLKTNNPVQPYISRAAMSMRKRTIFSKLMRLVGRGNQVQSSRKCLTQIYEERKRQRQRTSQSSHLSQIEPMPTIEEEDEEVFLHEQIMIQLPSRV